MFDWHSRAVLKLAVLQFSVIFSFKSYLGFQMIDDILTIKELADYLKLNEKTTYRLVSKGDIPGFKIGGLGGLKELKLKNG